MRVSWMLAVVWALGMGKAQAQDPTFSHGYYNPVYLNPALAGSNSGMRVILNDKHQWGRVPGIFNTSTFSVDMSEPCYSVGWGISGMHDVAGEGFMTTNRLGFTGAWSKTLVRRRLDMGAGFSANFAQKGLDWSKLEFSDQFDPVLGKIYSTGANLSRFTGHSYLDIDVGIQFKLLSNVGTNRQVLSNFGLAVKHINRPDDAIIGSNRLPSRYTFHAASIVPVGRKWKQNGSMFMPYLVYNWQDMNAASYAIQREVLVGCIGFSNPLLAGVYYHNGKLPLLVKNINQLGGMVGYQQPFRNSSYSWQLVYSYDFTLNGLGFSTTGTHEVSLIVFIDGVSLFCKGSKVMDGASKCFRDKRSGFIPQI